jgi:hypothetical protein
MQLERLLTSREFTPSRRDVADVQHILAGVASRSLEKAEAFIKDHAPESMKTKAFGSYEELFKSPVSWLFWMYQFSDLQEANNLISGTPGS